MWSLDQAAGQPFRVLTVLLQRPVEVVTREELRNQNWPPDTFVDFENSLNTAINKLRDALGDSADTKSGPFTRGGQASALRAAGTCMGTRKLLARR